MYYSKCGINILLYCSRARKESTKNDGIKQAQPVYINKNKRKVGTKMEKLGRIRGGILALLIIVALIAVIGGTYARYQSTGTANAVVNIAKWSVKLNGEDISTASAVVEPALVYANNEFVADNKIAPGRTATFAIEFDPTDSEVAIDYTYVVDTSAIATALLGETGTNEADNVKYCFTPNSKERQAFFSRLCHF